MDTVPKSNIKEEAWKRQTYAFHQDWHCRKHTWNLNIILEISKMFMNNKCIMQF